MILLNHQLSHRPVLIFYPGFTARPAKCTEDGNDVYNGFLITPGSNDLSCSSNGDCNAATGLCECTRGRRGPTCSGKVHIF